MSQESKKECRWKCKYWGADPDDEYCGHPEGAKYSLAGINLNRALGVGRYAGLTQDQDPAAGMCKDRKLWEPSNR